MYVCMYVCMYACMHACMYVCMYVYTYLYIYTYVHKANIYIYIDYRHMYIFISTAVSLSFSFSCCFLVFFLLVPKAIRQGAYVDLAPVPRTPWGWSLGASPCDTTPSVSPWSGGSATAWATFPRKVMGKLCNVVSLLTDLSLYLYIYLSI